MFRGIENLSWWHSVLIGLFIALTLPIGYVFVSNQFDREVSVVLPDGPYLSIDADGNVLGDQVSNLSKAFEGQQVGILHFWATWCSACKKDETVFKEVAPKLAGRGVPTVFLATQDLKSNIKKFRGKVIPSVHYGFDENSQLASMIGVSGLPQTYVVNSKLQVLYRIHGSLRSGDLGRIAQLVEKQSLMQSQPEQNQAVPVLSKLPQ